MSKVAIVTGSIRPGRHSLSVANWVKDQADKRGDAQYDVVDIADFAFPVWDEVIPPRWNRYEKQITKDWSATISRYDGFIFVAPEYNHSITGALKNALDYLSAEFYDKVAGFVSYGTSGGVRAVEHLRGILSELQVAHVQNQVAMTFAADFEDFRDFTPSEHAHAQLEGLLDQLLPWTKAMELVRSGELLSPAS
jgi:NAD(P)H-dependent FMN reductase